MTTTAILRHGQHVFGDSLVRTFGGDECRTMSFAEIGRRVEQLAAVLRSLGITQGQRVATFQWNNQEHLEAYFAVSGMGAVLHTLNIRLSGEQLVFVINHAEDQVIIVDDSLVPLLAGIASRLNTVRHYIVSGDGDIATLEQAVPNATVSRYTDVLNAQSSGFAWPEIDERSAAAMCYTSGTTGDPKGVVYSHRSTYLHSMGVNGANAIGLVDRDSVLPIVPMFHANAWGLPYAGWLAGSDFVMPDRFLQPEPLCRLIAAQRPTVSGAVPSIWSEVLRHSVEHGVDLSSFRLVVCGGAAVPRSLIEQFDSVHGVRVVQGWGMTETSPMAALSHPPKHVELGTREDLNYRAMTGRVMAGVELRIVDDASRVLAWDNQAVGEIEVRGPWVTASYYRDAAPEKFDNGWLRTGDVGSVTPDGFVRITDRAKDVIKSGGEWISSVELENLLVGHPEVQEAAVIGVPDEKWSERPLACVVRSPGATVTARALRDFLTPHLARWQLPERWTFVGEIPKTSVGKIDKLTLRSRYAADALTIEVLT